MAGTEAGYNILACDSALQDINRRTPETGVWWKEENMMYFYICFPTLKIQIPVNSAAQKYQH